MNAEAIVAVSAAVTALTQLIKWSGWVDDKTGPVVVLVLSLLGVALWAYSQSALPTRLELFAYFAGWVAVSLTAAGIFGFTRAGSEAVTRTKAPPSGAGGSPTI